MFPGSQVKTFQEGVLMSDAANSPLAWSGGKELSPVMCVLETLLTDSTRLNEL